MEAPKTKIGVTLYTLRDHCQTAKDFSSTLGRIKSMGYEAVQISGIGDIPPLQIRDILDEHGMFCCATHESLDSLKTDPGSVAAKLKTIGCDFTAIGSGGDAYWTDDGAKCLAQDLNSVAKALADHGIQFGFHNHHREFARFGGRVFLEELFDRTEQQVCFEVDVHWVQRGGANPITWIRKVAGRMPVVHFKDFAMVGSDPVFCEVGEGNLEWEQILEACRETGVRWYIFEQDKPVAERDIFDSVELTYKNLRKLGVE